MFCGVMSKSKYYDGSRAPSPRERERHRRVPAAATTTAVAVVTPNDSDHTTAVVKPGPMSPTDIAPENQDRGVGATSATRSRSYEARTEI